MNNDPELDGKYLGTITKDFVLVAETLKEASYQIRKRGFSDFPIFPIAKQEIPIGQILISKEEVGNAWIYNASYLDEFLQRGLVDKERLDAFKQTFKNPDEFCCLFVVDLDFTRFTFIPFPED